jgi:4a-hydroxytetrahydrobiopterin dehydratase
VNKESLLNELNPGWELTYNNTRLLRSFSFKNYKEAWDLVNKISEYAEAVNHHPELRFGWGHLEVEIWTHTENDLSEQDFDFAKKVDQLSMTT